MSALPGPRGHGSLSKHCASEDRGMGGGSWSMPCAKFAKARKTGRSNPLENILEGDNDGLLTWRGPMRRTGCFYTDTRWPHRLSVSERHIFRRGRCCLLVPTYGRHGVQANNLTCGAPGRYPQNITSRTVSLSREQIILYSHQAAQWKEGIERCYIR